MKGIVLASHGKMADGMLESAKLFYGEDLKQIETVQINNETSIKDLDAALADAIKKCDSGEGVIILADLLGGTCANRCAYLQSDKVQVLTGMNLTMLLEILGLRQEQTMDMKKIVSLSKDAIRDLNDMMAEISKD